RGVAMVLLSASRQQGRAQKESEWKSAQGVAGVHRVACFHGSSGVGLCGDGFLFVCMVASIMVISITKREMNSAPVLEHDSFIISSYCGECNGFSAHVRNPCA